MIEWCRENLAASGFEYVHQNVALRRLNPGGTLRVAPIPTEESFTLILALSFFTHLLEDRTEFYLDEVVRSLPDDGLLHSTWFLFDKSDLPMMQDFQNALLINADDPTNAVIYDREWLLCGLLQRGLAVRRADPPEIRGFQWQLWIGRGGEHVPMPFDTAPRGRRPPPV